jgi:hypothetical protein
MADFQNIELYAKKKPSGWLGKLLFLSIFLLIIVIVLYLAANFYTNYINKSIADINNKIKNLSNEISASDRNEVLGFYSQLINLKGLLASHIYTSKIFNRLELVTHPKVAFSSFSYDGKNNSLKLEAYTDSLDSLAQQLLAFQKVTDFTKVNISDIRLSDNKISFSVEINFKPSFILK